MPARPTTCAQPCPRSSSVAPQPGEDAELAERAERLTNLEELRLAAAGARELLSAEESEGADALGLLDNARRQLERVAPHDAELRRPGRGGRHRQLPRLRHRRTALHLSRSPRHRRRPRARGRPGASRGARRAHPQVRPDARRRHRDARDRQPAPARARRRRRPHRGARRARSRPTPRSSPSWPTTSARAVARPPSGSPRPSPTSSPHSPCPTRGSSSRSPSARSSRRAGATRSPSCCRPHPGAEPRPLGKGASGGELSRVMLAIEVVHRRHRPGARPSSSTRSTPASAAPPRSRSAAGSPGWPRTSQVIVVTHLAQVAAFATNHLTVVKGSDGAVTESSVRRLDGDERIAEMARLLSGLPDSESGARARARAGRDGGRRTLSRGGHLRGRHRGTRVAPVAHGAPISK